MRDKEESLKDISHSTKRASKTPQKRILLKRHLHKKISHAYWGQTNPTCTSKLQPKHQPAKNALNNLQDQMPTLILALGSQGSTKVLREPQAISSLTQLQEQIPNLILALGSQGLIKFL